MLKPAVKVTLTAALILGVAKRPIAVPASRWCGGGDLLDDILREELATLGQRLEFIKVERRDAVQVIGARLREHREDVSVAHVARLTTLSPSTLYAMLRDDD